MTDNGGIMELHASDLKTESASIELMYGKSEITIEFPHLRALNATVKLTPLTQHHCGGIEYNRCKWKLRRHKLFLSNDIKTDTATLTYTVVGVDKDHR
jgi:hypothetical protein